MDLSVSSGSLVFLVLAILLALSFEFVNGFHDTANAVATVIYTRTWPPIIAVVWSGCWNLIGVLTSSGAVAFGVVAPLPIETVLNIQSVAGFATVFALLISAIIWNLGTWYFGLPASSSHSLVGSILGVGLASSMISGDQALGEGVNWAKAYEVGLSLLISPLIGFVCAALLLLLSKALLKKPELFRAPDTDAKPPMWVRVVLVGTCTGVSYAHGSNDGQKGMGLIMLILIGILPFSYAVNLETSADSIAELAQTAQTVALEMDRHAPGVSIADAKASGDELSAYLKTSGTTSARTFAAVSVECWEVARMLAGVTKLSQLSNDDRGVLRRDLYLTAEALSKLVKLKHLANPAEQKLIASLKTRMDLLTKFVPTWVKVAVALALGLGTMIG